MRKNSLHLFKLHYGQVAAQYIAALLLALGVTTFRLSQLLPGINSSERSVLDSSRSIAVIRQNPIHLPYKLLEWAVLKLQPNNLTAARLASVAVGLVCLLIFFHIVRRWFGFWVAIVTTFLLLTSSWFLHLTRQVSPDVTQLSLVALIGFGLWLKEEKWSYLALLIGVGLAATSLYIPGLFWLLFIGAIHQRRYIASTLSDTRWLTPVAVLLFGVLVIPLAWAALKNPAILFTSFAVPDSLRQLLDVGKHILTIPGQLLWHGPGQASYWLPGTPLLDYLTAALALIGLYSYAQHRKLDRSKIALGFLVVATALIGLTGSPLLGFLLPVIYLFVAAGLALMIQQWLTVFPRNPFARGLMVALILLAVTSVSYYQLSHYFLAWARHPETRATFNRY